jgi:sulfite reductase alpha subunit-like flavoprotein
MKKFWKFLLRKTIPPDALSHLHFAVFGLGDSSYEKQVKDPLISLIIDAHTDLYVRFNFPAKKLFKRLSNLGASPLVPRGDGDDQHYLGIEGTLNEWLDQLWDAVLKIRPLPPGTDILSADLLPDASYSLEFLESSLNLGGSGSSENGDFVPNVVVGKREVGGTIKMWKVVENRRLTLPHHFQDVRHVELQLGEGDR